VFSVIDSDVESDPVSDKSPILVGVIRSHPGSHPEHTV